MLREESKKAGISKYGTGKGSWFALYMMVHLLPICGPGHVEKSIIGATLTVRWDLIGLENIANICNFKNKH